MKLQHLTVIFVIIMLPISLIISAYTQMQIDTLVLQGQYDSKLMDATYDAIKAFDINTTGNDLSNVADTVREDILAAISTFMTSFASAIGVPGYQDEYIKPYIPAILFTLYDGYYIYTPSLTDNGYTYTLQPYNYYSVRYKHGSTDIVVNYTLDNYIVIYGYVNGDYTVKSGYLVNNIKSGTEIKETESINEYVPVAQLQNKILKDVYIGKRDLTKFNPENATGENGEYLYERNDTYYIDPKSAKSYYSEAAEFTDWVKKNLGNIVASDAIRTNSKIEKFESDTGVHIFDISNSNDPEVVTSDFNRHRIEIIEDSIENNLNYAITAYSKHLGGNANNYDFRMPELDADEWVTISSNICMVAFVQGMPVGSRFYNNYAIVRSTTNKFFVDPENIYYIDESEPEESRYYHKIDCPYLNKYSNMLVGFSNYSFQPFYIKVSELNKNYYYWRHREKACYYCIVNSGYESECKRDEITGKLLINKLSDNKKKAYYTAVAREKYRQYKTTDYFSD